MKEAYYYSPEFEGKKEKIIREGASNLHLTADFDSTLSLPTTIDGESTSSFSIIRTSSLMSDEYREAAQALFAHYAPIERDHTLNVIEKVSLMQEWWTKHLSAMVQYGLSKQVIRDSVSVTIRALRTGFEELVELSDSKSIPFIIFSAGLGDVISELLDQKQVVHNSLHILSNRFDFDPVTGLALGYREPIIHSMNKNEVGLKSVPEVAELLKYPLNVIVLGDSLDDCYMADGVGYETVLKIGFLNHFSEERLEVYKKLYDVVLPHDAGLDVANNVLKLL
jgi:cytosolic 5'-nucleotidase 3